MLSYTDPLLGKDLRNLKGSLSVNFSVNSSLLEAIGVNISQCEGQCET